MSDEFGMEFPPARPRKSLVEAMKGNRREQLEAMRDYVADQLEVHMCKTCLASKLRSGDQASLLLRLQQITEGLESLPSADEEDEVEAVMREVRGLKKGANSRDVTISGRGASRRARGNR